MSIEEKIVDILERMTLHEKLGQMQQLSGTSGDFEERIRRGMVGSFLNVKGEAARKYQEIAVKESRLGIPLVFGRDVIHGYRTVMPIPLGMAASFNPGLVEEAAGIAAEEAAFEGIHWTFAPMVDVSRDSRWGRVAESAGEDTFLNASMGAAMVRGFQKREGDSIRGIAACAKHYVGYGAAEGGRDYNTTLIPEGELRDCYLPPFKACADAGAATFMSAFNDLNGVPTSGNRFTIRKILKDEWAYDGMVVSDWGSITEMVPHGYCADGKDAACKGIRAGVDMEMVSEAYIANAEQLLAEKKISMEMIDDAVARILRLKFRLGLFDKAPAGADDQSSSLNADRFDAARRIALESCVLIKNDGALPLAGKSTLAVIGPLADSPADMLGTWAMDGRPSDVKTPLDAFRSLNGSSIKYAAGMPSPRSFDKSLISGAVDAARGSDAAVIFLGEEAVMSGEAHSRAYLELPGVQLDLLKAVREAGKPVVVVIFAGRGLCLDPILKCADALLYAWHPGVAAGPAIADLLFGKVSPSGRLPISLPSAVGQSPIYYNRRNTGRPAQKGRRAGIPAGTPLDPREFCAAYIDADPFAEFPFGFGLTYGKFEYGPVKLSEAVLSMKGAVKAKVELRNSGKTEATEVVQLYLRDLVGSRTRPVRELKGFRRVTLKPGETAEVAFKVEPSMLAFHDEDMNYAAEPGLFHLWIAPDSSSGDHVEFELKAD